MSIKVRCECGKQYAAAEAIANKNVRCRECGAVIKVPPLVPRTETAPNQRHASINHPGWSIIDDPLNPSYNKISGGSVLDTPLTDGRSLTSVLILVGLLLAPIGILLISTINRQLFVPLTSAVVVAALIFAVIRVAKGGKGYSGDRNGRSFNSGGGGDNGGDYSSDGDGGGGGCGGCGGE